MPNWPSAEASRDYFSPDAAAATQRWRAAAETFMHSQQRRGRQSWQYPHPGKGPHGEALATDCLWLGDPAAQKVLILLSGTHGVEAYAGSAIQLMLLEQIAAGFDASEGGAPAVLFVHALTPWGFAWCRRCDEQGIDLNRHFVDFNQALPANADYATVRPWLFEPDPGIRAMKLAEAERHLGRRAYEIALSGGQHLDASGPFYGGAFINHGRAVTEDLFGRLNLTDRTLCVLDLHTGLGPWGYGELICDHPPGSAGVEAARRLFGGAVTEPALGTSASVPKTGLADYAWHAIMNSDSCYLTLEFGTYPTDKLFERLIEDHQFWSGHQPTGPEDARWLPHRQRLLEHFCPADSGWQQSVLLRALQVFEQAWTGMKKQT